MEGKRQKSVSRSIRRKKEVGRRKEKEGRGNKKEGRKKKKKK